ncbi:MAG: hypothetical protein HC902_07325 [Calothrix sp. SM1_5_4]|nr:hypothetical protein [Calothrix sp. SM1_5_4]
MSYLGKSLLGVLALVFSAAVHAQDIPLQNIDVDDFKKLVGDFSANSLHTSVSGAGSLGSIFGFELGLVAGMTRTPEVDRIVHEADASANAKSIPHAALLGVITVPFAITVEAGFVPKVGQDEFKFSSFAGAVKWTPTDLFFELPVSLAAKAHFSQARLDFKETIQSVPTTFKYENSIFGLTALVSKNLGIVEPYFGLGWLSGKGELDVNGSTNVFADVTYAASQSASATRTTTTWMLGAELKLLVLKLGAEYASLYGTNRYTGKLSFYF